MASKALWAHDDNSYGHHGKTIVVASACSPSKKMHNRPTVKKKGPEFIRFFKPILQVLKNSGGSGTAAEVTDQVIELLKIPAEEQEIILKSGQSRVYNQVQWSRFYLVKAGYLDFSKRGVWSLTEKGGLQKQRRDS